jgi:hypothetical protein
LSQKYTTGNGNIQLYFGGPELFSKEEPDLLIYGNTNDAYGQNALVSDANDDKKADLIITESESSLDYWPIRNRFFIYDGESNLDSIADDTLLIDTTFLYRHYTAACLGDINGDGYADYGSSPGPAANPSYLLIIYGDDVLDSIPDHKIMSPWNDRYFGYGIDPLGDINKDGYDDFAVMCKGRSACIFYGGNPFDTVPLILEGPGQIARDCGDINNDGWDDLAIGYRDWGMGVGAFYVYFGAYWMDTIADIFYTGNDVWYYSYNLGKSVGPAGDFNGDGIDDLAVGAADCNFSDCDRGMLYIFAGDPTLPTDAEDEPDIPVPERHNVLKQNYPNPFNNRTIIEYYLHGIAEREIELNIYNLLGQKVRTLYKGIQTGGSHSVYWDGRDDYDNDVPSGIYFYQLQSGDKIISKKMLYLK